MKKGLKSAGIVAGVTGVCLVATVSVLGVRMSKGISASRAENATQTGGDFNTITREEDSTTLFDYTYESSTTLPSQTQEQSSTAAAAAPKAASSKATTAKKAASAIASTIAKTTQVAISGTKVDVVVEKDVTMPVLNDQDTKKASAPAASSTVDSSLPNDMYFTGLQRSGYSVIGPKTFIYNDDTSPDCTQRKFGYNVLYDAGAKLIDFSIETSRIKFNYDNKEYMIQLWKGQYISGDIGTVGGEVGIYTRPLGKASAIGHYDCAAEDDWLWCELTIFWDENSDGNYLPQLTRKYAKHWWETGYVDGQLKNRKDSSPLRILQRITFKDETQAQLFESALVKAGFRSVETFNPTVKDTCKRYGKDVIYLWQDVR